MKQVGRPVFRYFFHHVAGSAAVEFALVTPLLVALLFGLTDTGRAISQRVQMIDAAQQGVQYGQLRNPVGDDVTKILSVVGPGKTGNARVTAVKLYCECVSGTQVACNTICPGNAPLRRYLDVQVSETYKTIFPYPIVGSAIPLQAQAVTRLQ